MSRKGFGRWSLIGWAIIISTAVTMVSCQQPPTGSSESHAPKISVSGEPLKIGYLICNSKEETVQRFAAVAAYLAEKIGRKVIMIPMNTYEVEENLKEKGIKFFKVNSIVYMQLKAEMDINLIAGEKRGPLGRFTTGKIIAKRESGIKSLQDLKGKKFVFGPMFAPFGYLVQYDLLLKNGINPEEDIAYYAIPWGAYKHEKAIYKVKFGEFDAGSGPDLDIIEMNKNGRIRMGPEFPEEEHDFVVLAESEPAPYCTFGSTKDADPELAKKIKSALLALTDRDLAHMTPELLEVEGMEWDKGDFLRSGEVLNVCKVGKIDGYEDAKDADYDVLREMARNAKISPYSKYDD